MSNHQILDSLAHRDLRVRMESSAALGDDVMACLLMPAEFRRAQADFPILFRRDLQSAAFSAVALFGFENGENLFLEEDRWDAAYKPLAQAVKPFLIGRSRDDASPAQVHVDLDSPRIVTDGTAGVRLFTNAGQPTPLLDDIAQQLGDLDDAFRASESFFTALTRHDLLEPFRLDVPLTDGSNNSLVGFHIVNEDRLRVLDGATLADLHSAGHLMPLFMAVASLAQLTALVARKNRRVGGG
ncbi:SapC family protein [Sphingobium algorifonticola]|uniref:Multidrug transporter n=1 Tax=Sphingobium algorifonticola TaxID=2008318 RepID=A0A437J9V1_9SPHN|nr:SapC family protein [Sphingobium algorifonticola]RVT42254.1 multidrug transporter [Sphingobium algorifonticola]